MSENRKTKIILWLSIFAWMFAIFVGLIFLLRYESAPATSGTSPSVWPTNSQIQLTKELPTLVMMIHPRCPCSRASIGELEKLMTQEQGKMSAKVLFVKPQNFPDEWEKTDIWSSAAMIPGVEVGVDYAGIEARRFGSYASGQVMLYSEEGRLLFSGGITASRGHLGDSDGERTIAAILNKKAAESSTMPVYGCPLFEESNKKQIKESCNEPHNK